MSDVMNPYQRDEEENPVAKNTNQFTQSAAQSSTPPAYRKEYTVKKPLVLPKTYTTKAPAQGAGQTPVESGTEYYENATKTPENVTDTKSTGFSSYGPSRGAALEEIRKRNIQQYDMELPQWEYEALNKHLVDVAKTDGLEAAENEKYKYLNAMQYQRMFNIPLEQALKNVDDYNAALFGREDDKVPYKGKLERLGDAWTLGVNTVRRSKLGRDLMLAEEVGNEKTAAAAWEAIKALDHENELLSAHQPQAVGMTILTAGLQSLPYTAVAAGAGLLGGLIGVGPVAGFAAGYDLMRADSYINLRQAGADTTSARAVSAVSGALQAAVEQSLGIVAHGAAHGAAIAGKEVLSPLTKGAERTLADKVTKLAFSHFKLKGTAARMATSFAAHHIADVAEEGAEEFLQQVIDSVSFHVADALSENDVEADNLEKIVRDSVEAFKGGVAGALFLGVFDAGFSAKANIRDFKDLKEAAETIPSREAFKKATKENLAFEGMTDEKRIAAQNAIYDSFENVRESADEKEIENIRATKDIAEGVETVKADEETGEEIAAGEAVRDESGKLYVQEDKNVSGNTKRLLFGDPTREGTADDGNRYGYIEYTENGDKVNIEKFVMAGQRENIRQEAWEMFAERVAGKDIEWNTRLEEDAKIKQAIIDANPSGKSAGLNYYGAETKTDAAERVKLVHQMKELFPKIKREQYPAAIVALEALARHQKGSLTEWVQSQFHNGEVFTNQYLTENFAEAAQTAQAQGATVYGAVQFTKDLKAAIYVSEHADFDTFLHELLHFAEHNLTDEERTRMETLMRDLMEKTGKEWKGWDTDAQELFADTGVDVFRTGKAPKGYEDIFRKIAEFIRDIFRGFQRIAQGYINDDIVKAYHELLDMDNSLLRKAEEAVAQADKERKEAQLEEEVKAWREEKQKEAASKTPQQTTAEHVSAKADEIAQSVTADPVATDGEKASAVLDAAAVGASVTQGVRDMLSSEGAIDLGEMIFQVEKQGKQIFHISEGLTEVEEIFDYLQKALSELGYSTETHSSGLSNSHYITIKNAGSLFGKEQDDDIEIRIADHNLPPTYDNQYRGDFDVRGGADKYRIGANGDALNYDDLLNIFAEKKSFYLPEYEEKKLLEQARRKALKEQNIADAKRDELKAELRVQALEYAKNNLPEEYNEIKRLFTKADELTGDKRKQKRKKANAKLNEIAEKYLAPNPSIYFQADEENGVRKQAETRSGKGPQPTTDYVTFSPVQIKSATDNTGAFDPHNSSILFQIAGEIGAARLDAADEETREGKSRMENLAVAKSMEAAGKDAQAIRLATGWEKGADGLWRYEIDDSKVELYDEQFFPKRHLGKDEEFEKIEQAIRDADYNLESIPVQDRQYWEAVIDSENDYVREYIDFDSGTEKWKKTADLERILNAPELFEAYPQLKKIQFYVEKLPSGTLGRFEEMKNRIVVDPMARLGVLLHEIQHAIQRIEGFATGGSSDQFNTITKETLRKKKVDKLLAEAQAIFDKQSEDWKTKVRAFNRAQIADDLEEMRRISDELDAEAEKTKGTVFDDDFNDYVDLMAQAKDYNSGSRDYEFKELTPGEQYHALAGEVEARNVEARRKLTPMQRAQTLLALTEDVARDDQIVLFPAQKVLFQTAYHGSGASFDRFNTEEYGLSGEGSMSFGWGTYLSGSENIARDYAERQASGGRALIAQMAQTLLDRIEVDGYTFEQAKDEALNRYKNWERASAVSKQQQKARYDFAMSVKSIDDLKGAANVTGKRNLYTVDVPDGKYLQWDKHLPEQELNTIKAALQDRGYTDFSRIDNLAELQKKYADNPNATYTRSSNIYKVLGDLLGSQKAASQFLHSIGYTGIDYPAGTIYGNGNDARNYVIFDDSDIAITGHVLFQTAEVTDEGLKDIIAQVKPSEESAEYKKQYYDNVPELYEVQKFKTSDGKMLEINAPKKRHPKQHEIDEAYYFKSKGYKVAFLNEPSTKGGKPDLLLNENVIVELKQVTGNANTAAKRIREAINKQGVDVPAVFFMDEAVTLSDDDVIAELEKDRHIERVVSNIVIIRNYDKISVINKKAPSSTPNVFAYNSEAKLGAVTNDNTLSLNVNQTISENDGIFFQTESAPGGDGSFADFDADIIADAADFDSWEEWRDFVETMYSENVTPEMDDAWYKNVWEGAHKAQEEELKKVTDDIVEDEESPQEVSADAAEESDTVPDNGTVSEEEAHQIDSPAKEPKKTKKQKKAEADAQEAEEAQKDADFIDLIQREGELDKFLSVLNMDWLKLPDTPGDMEEALEAERLLKLRAKANIELKHGSWGTAALKAGHVQYGENVGLSQKHRKTLLTLMKKAPRDYRNVYAAYMKNPDWIVPEKYTTAAKLAYRINSPVEEMEALTPEERREFAKRLDFEDLKKEVYDGTFEMDFENIEKLVDGYETDIKALEGKIDKLKGMYHEDEVLLVKNNAEIEKLQGELKSKRESLSQAEAVRDIKIRLIKSVNRRVDFRRIMYDEGRKVIAIQALFQPLLKKYVNQFINMEGAYIRDAYSRYKTDYAYRSRITALAQNFPGRGARNLKKVLELFDTKSFEKWTADEKLFVAEHLPKTDWVKELNLEAIEAARAGSLQLDLQSEETQELLREILPPELLAELSRKELRKWTLEQMEELTGIVDKLYSEGREKLRAKREADRARADKLRKQIEKTLKSSGIVIHDDDTPEEKERKQKLIDDFKEKKLPKILATEGVKGTLSEAKRGLVATANRVLHGYDALNIRRIARMLDNGKEGVNTSLLYYREDECFNTKRRAIESQQKAFDALIKEQGIELSDLYKTVDIEFSNTVTGVDDNGKAFETVLEEKPKKIKLTVDELLYAYAAKDNERSYAAVAGGNLFDEIIRARFREAGQEDRFEELAKMRMDKVLDAAKEILHDPETGEKYQALLSFIQRAYDEQGKRLNQTAIDVYNAPMWIEEHYVPLQRLEANGDVNEATLKNELLASVAGTGSAGSWIARGNMKSRIDISYVNQKPVRMGLVSTWTESVESTEHIIAYGELNRDLNRIYRGRDAGSMKQYMENRYGKDMVHYIDQYLKEVANPNMYNNPRTALDRVVRVMRGKTAPAYLAWKMSGIIKQFCTSPWPYLQYMSPMRYAKACMECMHKDTQDAIKAKSAFMNSRVYDPLIDLINEQKNRSENKVTHALNSFEKLGMQGLEWVDWACVAPGWLAVYQDEYARLKSDEEQNKLVEKRRKELESYKDANGADWVEAEAQKARLSENEIERLAVRKADDIVRMTQPSSRNTDIAPLFKGTNEVAKALLQFTTSLNVIWQNLRADLPVAIREREFKQVVGCIAGYMLAGAMVGMVSAGFDDDDDDAEKKAMRILYWNMTQFTDSVPVLGSMATSTAEGLVTGKWQYGSSTLFPVPEKAMNTVRSLSKGDFEKALINFGQVVGLTTGLPVSGAKEALYIAGIGDGKDGLDFHPTAVLGRRPKE